MQTKILNTEEGPILEIPDEIMQALKLKIGDALEVSVMELDSGKQLVLTPRKAVSNHFPLDPSQDNQ